MTCEAERCFAAVDKIEQLGLSDFKSAFTRSDNWTSGPGAGDGRNHGRRRSHRCGRTHSLAAAIHPPLAEDRDGPSSGVRRKFSTFTRQSLLHESSRRSEVRSPSEDLRSVGRSLPHHRPDISQMLAIDDHRAKHTTSRWRHDNLVNDSPWLM